MSAIRKEFGYYPDPLQLQTGKITIEPKPDHAQLIDAFSKSEGIEKDWIYAPPRQIRIMGGGIKQLPYPSRIFGLPKTHDLVHSSPYGEDHIAFLLWALSFFTGMRLTSTEAGFLDATPIRPGTLVDFILSDKSLVRALELAEIFWNTNNSKPKRAKLWSAAVHALFLGRNPQLLQYEIFMHNYMAIDACFALAKDLGPTKGYVNHSQRIAWICNHLKIHLPVWASPSQSGESMLAGMRNDTIHEALYVGEPLGFALHGVGTGENIALEMAALICRILVALIGGDYSDYVKSRTDTRGSYLLVLT